jgi:hypothetical protein
MKSTMRFDCCHIDIGNDTEMPDTSNDTKMPSTSNNTEMPDTSNDTKMPSTSNNTEMPDTSNDTKMPSTSNDTEMPDTSNDTKMPSTSNNTEMPDTSNDTKMPSTSYDTEMPDFQVEIKKILEFVLVVLIIYEHLMGYIERGQWITYSNGAWEFCATYVCIELRLGSYPFQKFRETPRKFSGVTPCKNPKTGVIRYEPWVKFRRDKFDFQGQKTAEKAARIRDVAKFWLKIKGRQPYNPYNFGEEDYNYLNFVQEFHQQQSDDEIKRLVLEHAQ